MCGQGSDRGSRTVGPIGLIININMFKCLAGGPVSLLGNWGMGDNSWPDSTYVQIEKRFMALAASNGFNYGKIRNVERTWTCLSG